MSSADRWRTLLFSKSFRIRSRGPVAFRPLVFRSWTLVTEDHLGKRCPFPLSYSVLLPRKYLIVPRILILALPFLAACGLAPSLTPYRMEIQQGNYITQEMVAQLKPGLTRDQVRFVLGTP